MTRSRAYENTQLNATQVILDTDLCDYEYGDTTKCNSRHRLVGLWLRLMIMNGVIQYEYE